MLENVIQIAKINSPYNKTAGFFQNQVLCSGATGSFQFVKSALRKIAYRNKHKSGK